MTMPSLGSFCGSSGGQVTVMPGLVGCSGVVSVKRDALPKRKSAAPELSTGGTLANARLSTSVPAPVRLMISSVAPEPAWPTARKGESGAVMVKPAIRQPPGRWSSAPSIG
jgi:hypothetical protein